MRGKSNYKHNHLENRFSLLSMRGIVIVVTMMASVLCSSTVKAFNGPVKRAAKIITVFSRNNYSFSACDASYSIRNDHNSPKNQYRNNRNYRLFFSSSYSSNDGLGENVNPEVIKGGNDDEEAYLLELQVETPEEMEEVGAMLSMGTKGGDIIFLGGDLGAGKTCFSRGFVRARTGSMDLSVTSPTYLLSNAYPTLDNDNTLIHHMDLYRLSGNKDDFDPLDLANVFTNCISLIEWPSRLGELTPSERLEISIKIDTDLSNEDEESESRTRILTLTPYGKKWKDKLLLLDEGGYLDDLIIE